MRLFMTLLAILFLVGCGSSDGDDSYSEHRSSTIIAYDPEEYNPRQQIAIFRLNQDQHYEGGNPSWSQTNVSIENISGYTISFNFILSGPGWRFETAIYEIPPHGVVSFNDITSHFRALDNFWLTIPEVVYSISSAG